VRLRLPGATKGASQTGLYSSFVLGHRLMLS
jgi:hypothetical protein